MATYQITTPDGAVYEITQPDTPAVDPAALNYDLPQTDENTVYATPAEKQLTTPEALQLVSQAGLRGIGDLMGAAYDLPNAAFMGGQWLGNKIDQGAAIFGNLLGTTDRPVPESVPPVGMDQAVGLTGADEQPFNLSDFIANTASDIDALIPAIPGHERVPPMTREDMGAAEPLYDPIRFGAGAGFGGSGLAVAGMRKAGQRTPDLTRRGIFDNLTEPYADAPVTTIARDTAAGIGAGVGQEVAPDEGLMAFFGPLLGAAGGSAVFGSALSAGKMAGDAAHKLATPDISIGGEWFDSGVVDQVRRALQNSAKDPLTGEARHLDAAAQIKERGDFFRDADLPVPDAGLLSEGNLGLQDVGHYLRVRNKLPFMQSDQNLKDAASSRITGLKDPEADLDAVRRSIDASEESYRMSRDAEALPLLAQAEQSGVTVDASSVAALIDKKMMTAKRDPVRTALAKARKYLNVVGGDELDTSISGLYEARKAINDVIEGRSDDATGRFASKELIEVRNALDEALTAASPEFGQYLQKYREGSEPLDDFGRGTIAENVRGSRDIRNVVEQTLNDVWGGKATMQDLKALISGDPEADRALAAAVSDVISRRVTGVVKSGGDFQVEAGKLSRAMKDYEDTLAEVYTPEQMNTLRQGQALLESLRNIPKGAVAGSNTADKMLAWVTGPQVEALLKARYGVLKGGGILRTLRVVMESLPNNQRNVDNLMMKAYFNPDVMEFLLTGKVRDFSRGESNAYVRSLLAGHVASQSEEE